MKTEQMGYLMAFRAIAEKDKTFLEILPTLTKQELIALIERRPELWARYQAFTKTLDG